MTTEENKGTETVSAGTGINWTKVAVRDAHGAIDLDATIALINEELAMAMDNEIDMSEIAGAVDKVFVKLLNGAQTGSLDLNELASRSIALLGEVPFGSATALTERVKNYVRGESEAFVASNGAEGKAVILRGKAGGVRPATAKTVEDYRAFQARKAAKTATAAK